MTTVTFSYTIPNPRIRDVASIKRMILLILKEQGRELDDLNYVFCAEDQLLELNKTFLGHHDHTDIITFDLSDDLVRMAEIYICVERVRENAKIHGTTFRNELLRVIFHGALHLCGFKDKKPADQKKMRAAEDHYITRFTHA